MSIDLGLVIEQPQIQIKKNKKKTVTVREEINLIQTPSDVTIRIDGLPNDDLKLQAYLDWVGTDDDFSDHREMIQRLTQEAEQAGGRFYFVIG